MLEVCLTGGIASGKSIACEYFRSLGVPVSDSDEAAREVVAPGTPGLRQVVERFGRDVLKPDGALDRRALRRRVFSDDDARRELESILHPLIRERVDRTLQRWAHEGHACAIRAVPLLVETGLDRQCRHIVVVDAPAWLQIRRLMRRDGESSDHARSMVGRQATRWERMAVADDVIDNGDDIDPRISLRPQVIALQRKFAALARACAAQRSSA